MSQPRRDPRYPRYNDGLDEDGCALPYEPWRKPYVHGCEKDAGDSFTFVSLIDATIEALDRCRSVLDIGDSCESPIEALLGAALLVFFQNAGTPLNLCKTVNLEALPNQLLLVPQFAWGYYRSDWAILHPRRTGALLIECDGKDWHSSPKQKAHDARKDAAAHDRGFLTMRFTGSQIYRDADGCAQKIFDAVCG